MVQGKNRIAFLSLVSLVAILLAFAGCGEDGIIEPLPQDPQHIRVQYVLVAFAGSFPASGQTRTKAAADSLADSLYAAARAGADFPAMVEDWSDSPARDTMRIANYGVTAATGEYRRNTLVPNFGDKAFSLEPDSVGLAEWDSSRAPQGWYVIRRID